LRGLFLGRYAGPTKLFKAPAFEQALLEVRAALALARRSLSQPQATMDMLPALPELLVGADRALAGLTARGLDGPGQRRNGLAGPRR
jgi:hypothetical protein